jgi:hypothetical protein
MLVEAHGKGGTASAGLIVRGWYRTPGFEVGGFLCLEIGERGKGSIGDRSNPPAFGRVPLRRHLVCDCFRAAHSDFHVHP